MLSSSLQFLRQVFKSDSESPAPYVLDVMTLEDRVLYSATPIPMDALSADGGAPDVSTISAEELAAAGILGNDAGANGELNNPDAHTGPDSDPAFLLQHADDGSLIALPLDDTDASALLASDDTGSIAHPVSHELVIVDSSIDNVSALVQELLQGAGDDRQFEIVYLQEHADAFSQIDSALAGDVKFDAVHLLAHGEDGKILLGDDVLDHHAIEARLDQLQHWADSLAEDADILLYGCDVASGSEGQAFLQKLSEVTGADVAASDDLTGTAALGGDWELERHQGFIETHTLMAADSGAWEGVLATFTVDNDNDSGSGSLRQAIIDANANAGTDTIDFSIPGASVHVISLASDLPAITEAVILDATTQNGYAGTPRIELDGSGYLGSSAGLYIEGNGSTIRGLAIYGFDDDGIEITGGTGGGDNNVIENNYIGLHANGTVDGNDDIGVLVRTGASGNTIQNNVISGNGSFGVQIREFGSDNNIVIGNIIGLTTAGTAAAGNANSGIQIYDQASSNQIGGTTAAERNIISGNGGYGIHLYSNVAYNQILGNYIGTNQLGTAAVGNTLDGIHIQDGSHDNIIGSSATGAGNLISGNQSGIRFQGSGVSDNVVMGNYIGTNAAGSGAIANSSYGIVFGSGAADNTIGGTATGEGNIIANSVLDGIAVLTTSGSRNTFIGNSIYSNGGLAIDLRDDGVTANDANDADMGVNGLQNFPTITSAVTNSSRIRIQGTINSNASTTLTLHFYSNTSADASGYGEGRTYLGSASVTTNGSGNANWFAELNNVVVPPGSYVTATATTANGSTSEFSAALAAVGEYGLWISAEGNTTSTTGGITTWDDSTIVRITDPNLAFGSGTSDGTASALFDADTFAADGNAEVKGLEYIDSTVVVGTVNTVTLQRGDVLFSVKDNETFNGVAVTKRDIVLFRPTTVGDFRSGTFTLFMHNPDNIGEDIRDFAVVESAMMVGGTLLQSGDMLMVFTSGAYDKDVQLFRATDMGAVNTAGTMTEFIDGASAGIDNDDHIIGLDIVNYDTTLGGVSLQQGQLLIALDGDDVLATNALSVTRNDIFVLNVTATGTGTSSGTASMLFRGSDVGLSGDAERFDALALREAAPNTPPMITSNGGLPTASVNVAENSTSVTSVTATDSDLPAQTISYSIYGGADAARFTINSSNGALTFLSGPNYEVPTDADADNIYEVIVAATDGSLEDVQTIYVTVTNVNEAPVNAVPGSQSMSEDGTLVFSSGGGNGISISDVDAGSGNLQVSLSVTNGTLTLSSIVGLTFITGDGTADATLQFTGTLAAINAALDGMSFAPTANFNGAAGIGIVTSDLGNSGSGGTLTDTDNIVITVSAVNDAPVLNTGASPTLNSEAEDAAAPVGAVGTLVSSLVDYSGGGGNDNVSDVDSGALLGIALTAADATNGTWYYSTNNGGAWNLLGAVSDSSALLLAADANSRLYFRPNADFNGTINSAVTFRAWDRTSGANGGTGDASVNGGSTAFSSNSDTAALTITAVNDAPVITSDGGGASASISIAENTTAVTTVTRSDVDGGTPVYTVAGGADAARFSIDSSTGVLTFVSAPDYDNPLDAGGNNVYDVIVQVSDGAGGTDTQAIAVTVTPVNDNNPVITSDGGGATAAISVAENIAGVTTVVATDADLPAQGLTYTIIGGADAGLFTLDLNTGVLTFTAAPDYETPLDAGGNNVYDVIVQVSDGAGGTDTQAIAVTVTPVNDNNPVITSDGGGATAAISVAENIAGVTTVVATDADLPAQGLTYTIIGGADAGLFTLDLNTGVLTFTAAPDYEMPLDAGGNNVYDVIVQVSDGAGGTDTQAIAVTVTPVNDNNPVITSDGGGATAAISVAENIAGVTTVVATDADLPAQGLTYTIIGGADAGLFTLDLNTGVLTFTAAPDYEMPLDAGGNNVYDVIVQVSDGAGGTDTQAIAVTVTPVNDNNPVITSDGGGATAAISVAENIAGVTTVVATDADLPAQGLTYTIIGGADAGLFTLDLNTGVLTFTAAPDYEMPLDAGGNNVYDVIVQVSDGAGGTDTQAIAVTVTPVNDNNPVITSDGGGATAAISVAENIAGVTTVVATDADLPAQGLTYTIIGGADAGLFTLDLNTGVLTFTAAPDYETPLDAGGNNVYDVIVQVSDGAGGTDTQAIVVTVTPVNDNNPVITSDGGGATAAVSVAENIAGVTTIVATDADLPAQGLTYTIIGGADAGLFTLDLNTGVLTFTAAPDYETPLDAGGNNVYDVIVQVSDGAGGTDTQAIAVTVVDSNELPNGASSILSGLEDVPFVLDPNDFGFSDADSGDGLSSVRIDSRPAAGTLTLSGVPVASGQVISAADISAGNLRFTPDANASGIPYATFNFTVQDQGGLFAAAPNSLTFSVSSVNDAPQGTGESYSIFAGNGLLVNSPGLLANDIDIENDTLSVSLVAGPSHGSLVLRTDGSFVYVADPTHFGTVTFTYQVSDGASSDTVTVEIQVIAYGTPVDGGPGGGGGDNDPSDGEDTDNGGGIIIFIPPDASAPPKDTPRQPLMPPEQSEVPSGNDNDDEKGEEIRSLLDSALDLADLSSMRYKANAAFGLIGGRASESLVGLVSNGDVQALDLLLNSLRKDLQGNDQIREVALAGATAATAALSAGYALWALKSGHLLASLLTGMPAWKHMDPLAVFDGRKSQEDEESLSDIATPR